VAPLTVQLSNSDDPELQGSLAHIPIAGKEVTGMEVRLYSDAPFPTRTDGGMRDDFEKMALEALRHDSTSPVYRFEEYGGRHVLRYATARVMQESCLGCHNNRETGRLRPDGKEWQVGDVRGVLEIIRPLDGDIDATRQGVRRSFWLGGGVFASVLMAVLLVLVLPKMCPNGSAVTSALPRQSR